MWWTFALDNDLLNAAEVNAESTPASVTQMLCNRRFGGVPDPYFLAFVRQLACSTKQQVAFSLRSIEALGDGLREMFLMVSYLSFLLIFLNSRFS